MRVFVTGASGFIGRALVLRLQRDGHDVSAWSRSPHDRDRLGADVDLVDARLEETELARVLERCHGVVNLAGAPIVGRWTPARKSSMIESRVGTTELLVRAMEISKERPRVLVSGSAIGVYGADRGDEILTETSTLGTDFLAKLCHAWEAEARRADRLGARVVNLRTGIVLGRGGGALAAMLPLFRLGLGGPIGSGRQWLSFVHLHDLVEMIATALTDERYAGPVNATAPEPVQNAPFARALGRALDRPAVMRVPAPVVRLALGEAASAILGGQRVLPRKLEELGFRHSYPTIDAALADVVGARRVDIASLPRGAALPTDATDGYLATRRPTHVLTTRTVLDETPDRAFEFFSHPENLGLMTPSQLAFHFDAVPKTMSEGATLDAHLEVAPHVPVKWRTRIERVEPGRRFIDSQLKGPYRSWWHEHMFRREGDHTVMVDRVFYSLPLGLLGRLVHGLFVARSLRRIFDYREHAVRLRFGGGAPRAA